VTVPAALLENENRLRTHIGQCLEAQCLQRKLRATYADTSLPSSAVLFLLGMHRFPGRVHPEPCLIFNERSQQVRQPGDLCFPGGGIQPRFDPVLARLLNLPGSPLARWPQWPAWRRDYPGAAARMALCLATGLRESFEEMRLNPFGITFLGPLPPERLVIFRHVIFPVVGWLGRQKAFKPNWEVAKIVPMPLRDFFNPGNYALFRLNYEGTSQAVTRHNASDFISFTPRHDTGTAPLWGATFRIVLTFLETVFGFQPPEMSSLPVVSGRLERHYTTGKS
jgi:8-oxo-dGTP pyrophosphatase MutT (NUDIX family)